ncbi:MAG TPA: KTSC domain-containing protein [Chloroflexia bacterium]|nr:KTSC domain-containing protein [Chloroflexia bacterium]
MELVHLDSSMVYAVAYDRDTEELLVIFTSGKTYIYEGVPRKVYDGLMSADSKGSYMGSFIIDAYPFSTPSHRRKR